MTTTRAKLRNELKLLLPESNHRNEASLAIWYWDIMNLTFMSWYTYHILWSCKPQTFTLDFSKKVSFRTFFFFQSAIYLHLDLTKVIKILGICKTWSLLGTISDESLPYIEHTRLCLVWRLEWGFWWIWHFWYTLRFKNTMKSEQNL